VLGAQYYLQLNPIDDFSHIVILVHAKELMDLESKKEKKKQTI
jgi:hypothetical protein